MANYYQHARSNYFRVKNPEEFRESCERWEVEVAEKNGRFAFYTEEDCPWYIHIRYGWDCPATVDGGPEFLAELTDQLADGEVAILMAIGWEAVRFLNGSAVALSPGREPLVVDLDDIYSLAAERWGTEPTRAEY